MESSNGDAAPRLSPPSVGPSGPRRAGEGVAEEEQRVVDAEWLQEREPLGGLPAAQLRVTLLAAGFVIGASGASVRELSQKTRTRIQSWTEKPPTTRARYESGGGSGNDRKRLFGVPRNDDPTTEKETKNVPTNPTRVFRVRGAPADVSLAAEIIREAVALYNALCEGKRRGEFVRRAQRVRDVDFSYQPPPKTAALACVGSADASARLPASREGDGRDSRAAFASPRSVFSLPAGTDPAVVAAAAAAAAAASRAVAGAYARADGSFGSFGDPQSLSLAADIGSGPRSNAYGSANPGGFSPGASPNANAYARGTPPYVAPTFPYRQPTRLHGWTGGSRGLNGSFDRAWSGGGDDGCSDPSTPAFARAGSNATLS